MIPRAWITEWRSHAPWQQDAQVEQDLVISRALVEIFAVPELAARLAFRGGTALHKLHLQPAARYSEDLDFVQIVPEPIGPTIDLLHAALGPWLGAPKRTQKHGTVSLVYRFDSAETPPRRMRLKVEVNSREHFCELGHVEQLVQLDSRWFSGQARVTTFDINELLGTKLRALYQRKKGRDLFDLWHVLERGACEPNQLVRCFARYMSEGGHHVSRAQFEANLATKKTDKDFRADMTPLLRPGTHWDFDAAMDRVGRELVALLPGAPWKGSERNHG